MNYETFVSSESFVLLYLPKMIFQKQLKSTLCLAQKVPVIIIINSNYRYAFMSLDHQAVSAILDLTLMVKKGMNVS